MAVTLKSTRQASSEAGVKMLVYGMSGSGKTTLIATMPDPIIISAEAGLMSLSGVDIPVIEITSVEALHEAYAYITGPEGARYKSVALDSASEIGENVLSAAKKAAKDPRQAYGEMADQMGDIIRAFRDIPGKHVLCIAKCEKGQDEQGRMLYSPSMPGNKVGQSLPYFFDEVLALRVEKDAEGNSQRALMCDGDGLWQAKDRSGKLDQWEPADLGHIIAKIQGAKA